ncbi:MAG: complex I NDUFA9 subunit family protein [Gemmatimonadota bacterium]
MILVTGATGFIGAEILRRASRRGWRVRGLARHPERAEALGRLPHVELFRGDVSRPDELHEALEGVETVVHLVGIIVETRAQSYEDVHVAGTRNVVEATRRAGISRYVHMSALGVAAGQDASDYYRTKWRAEEIVREAGLESTIFRPSVVFGRDDDFFNRFVRILRWSPVVPLPAGGRSRFQPVWLGDVAECFLQATRMQRTPEPVYDVAGPEIMTLKEIVRTLMEVTGRRRPILSMPVVPLRVAAAVMETALPTPPLTRDQLRMLSIDNVSDRAGQQALRRDFEIEHARLADKAATWLNPGRRDEESP